MYLLECTFAVHSSALKERKSSYVRTRYITTFEQQSILVQKAVKGEDAKLFFRFQLLVVFEISFFFNIRVVRPSFFTPKYPSPLAFIFVLHGENNLRIENNFDLMKTGYFF